MDTMNQRQRAATNQAASMGPGVRRDDEGVAGRLTNPVIPAQAGIQTRGPR